MSSAAAATSGPARQRPLARLALLESGAPTHRLSSALLDVHGRRYRLFRALPTAPAPVEGYPLLTMLDGNGAFDALTPDLLAAAPGLAVVGIGYDTPYRFDTEARTLDYSPAWPGRLPRPDSERPERMVGGADAFLDRLIGPLRAASEGGLAVDPRRRALWGHSMAGMLVLHAALARPGAFARHAAISPSVWWNDAVLLDFERQIEPPEADAPSDLLVILSDSERRSSATGPHWDGPAPHTLEMIARLERRPGLSVQSRVLPGLAHAETLPASLPASLAFAAGEAA
jgi:predicted alpha/beta superfamily hydrolase